MNKTKFLFMTSAVLAVFSLLSCGSTSSGGTSAGVITEKTETESKAPVEEAVEEVKAAVSNDEYSRAVGSLAVTKDTFEADKAEIMQMIDKLSTIMKDVDYQSWLLYVDNNSKIYWSNSVNLKKAQSKLPIKVPLRDLQDYFKYIFIPARTGRIVSEIRYVSDTYVKAVQVTAPATPDSEERYTVYYYFNKINGHWSLYLPKNGE